MIASAASNATLKVNLASLSYDDEVVEAITSRCTEVHSGARNIDPVLTQTMLPELSPQLLSRMAERQSFEAIQVSLAESGYFEYRIG